MHEAEINLLVKSYVAQRVERQYYHSQSLHENILHMVLQDEFDQFATGKMLYMTFCRIKFRGFYGQSYLVLEWFRSG